MDVKESTSKTGSLQAFNKWDVSMSECVSVPTSPP